jgi:hypothetical protein
MLTQRCSGVLYAPIASGDPGAERRGALQFFVDAGTCDAPSQSTRTAAELKALQPYKVTARSVVSGSANRTYVVKISYSRTEIHGH